VLNYTSQHSNLLHRAQQAEEVFCTRWSTCVSLASHKVVKIRGPHLITLGVSVIFKFVNKSVIFSSVGLFKG